MGKIVKRELESKYTKREMELLVLVAARLGSIDKKYPCTQSLIESLHSEIIALTIDWD